MRATMSVARMRATYAHRAGAPIDGAGVGNSVMECAVPVDYHLVHRSECIADGVCRADDEGVQSTGAEHGGAQPIAAPAPLAGAFT